MSTPDTKVPHPTDDELIEAFTRPDHGHPLKSEMGVNSGPECVMHNGLSGEADMTVNQKNILEGRICSLEEKLAISNEKRAWLMAQNEAADKLIRYKEQERVKVELAFGYLTRKHTSLKGVYAALQDTNRANIVAKEAHASKICMFASRRKHS